MKRISNGTEVLLTPESVDALQAMTTADLNKQPISGEVLLYHGMDQVIEPDWQLIAQPFLYPGSLRLISPLDLGPSGNLWFLGGRDPFSSLPNIIHGPIPTELLISHCTRILTLESPQY